LQTAFFVERIATHGQNILDVVEIGLVQRGVKELGCAELGMPLTLIGSARVPVNNIFIRCPFEQTFEKYQTRCI